MDSVEFYRQNFRNCEKLSKEETNSLIEKYQKGDGKALEKLISFHHRLALKEARDYANRYNYDVDDVVSYAMIGLIRAIKGLDTNMKYSFSTYGVKAIRRSIWEHVNKDKYGVNNRKKMKYSVSFVNIDYCDQFREKIALNVSDKKETYYFIEKGIQELLDIFSPREQYIIKNRFGIGCNERSNVDIAESLGVTRAAISKILKKCLRKLKHNTLARSLVGRKAWH